LQVTAILQYFAAPPTLLKSSVELQNSARRMDTCHPLKTVGIRGFWPRYARLETTHPPKVGWQQPGSTPRDPYYPPSCGCNLYRRRWTCVRHEAINEVVFIFQADLVTAYSRVVWRGV
jgi:hypothetical protein